ncbi:hypothetical protein CEY12_10340 [Chryseobacterium sp. T16E-39]|uniref:hypothetical protein n=1 Tax=Chryseobacterium sp. T16E-39 TaxID=2015076 RepID=UPI000B5B210F|nr:hypothetical protein [Chryseobacterium sp. T16E-39]ASK30481.1 hypothetical protein CEY12_10340 [Chryseobacterium sp. T16E-39]
MKLFVLFLLIICTEVSAQSKNANIFFENKALARKVNNVLSFIDISNTINLNDYGKSIIYVTVEPVNERYFSISLKNQLPTVDRKLFKCFKLENNRFIAFVDKSNMNFGQNELYKNNFEIGAKELVPCDELFKLLKDNKLPKIPENVFAYSIFEDTFVYLEGLATFDALQYLEIEYDLNKSTK